jgi:hypothetical protein
MKFIESPVLETLNALLECAADGKQEQTMSKILSRLELYSCKVGTILIKSQHTAPDKALLKHLDKKYSTQLSSVSPTKSVLQSHHLALSQAPSRVPNISRKTLFYLRATLNAAYPDYDFADIRDEAFARMKMHDVINVVTTALFSLDPHAYVHCII